MSEYFDPKDKANKPVLDYFESKTWLFVHSSSLVRNAIKKTMLQLGSKAANFLDAATIEDASKIIESKKPNYIVTNKTINDISAIPLYEEHLKAAPNRIQGGFFIITEEASQSEIAWALQYEMDGIITLPLNGTSMLKTFLTAGLRKISPTPYLLKIEEAREKYLLPDLDGALALFKQAATLDKKPFESLSFIGQIYYKKKMISESIAAYEESITYNNKYFKSLLSLSEIYYKEKDYKKAYDINLLMGQNYPTSPDRIPELIRLAIINKRYDDIANYYKIFQKIKDPSIDMQNSLAAGLAIVGKYFASENDAEKGVEALLAAYKFSNGKYEILKSITMSFQELKKSEILLELYEKTDLTVWPKEIQALYFHTLHITSKEDMKVVQMGEKLMKNNIVDILIYRGMVERSIKMKREMRYVNNLILEANQYLPGCQEELENLVKKSK